MTEEPGTRNLSELERRELRVLGVLLEKEQTTPEYYPLTLKAVVAACNQASNRDPVMRLGEHEVLNVLRVLGQDRLVERETGARVDRWRHRLDGVVRYNPAFKALLTILLLRGPQTHGELRARTGRMFAFHSLEEIEEALRGMQKLDFLEVHQLARRPGQKEVRWTLCGGQLENSPVEGEPGEQQARSGGSALEERLNRLEGEVAELRALISELQAQLK